MKKSNIEKSDFRPNKNRNCKVTQCGFVTEIMEMTNTNFEPTMRKINAEQGVILSTGEVVDFNKSSNRSENAKGIRKSMKNLRDLLNANITEVKNCRWVTLTYAENMQDYKRLYSDIDKYHKRWKYWHSKNNISIPEYIMAVEPQARGAWHCHIVYIYPDKAPFIPNDTLSELWGHGFVTVKKLDDVDNVGAYLTAYLCDVPVDELEELKEYSDNFEIKECEFIDEHGKNQKKKFAKGARISLYPSGMNFFRSSRGVKRPVVEWTTLEKANKKVSSDQLTFEKYIRLFNQDTGYENDISYKYYNSKRK